MLGRFKSWLSSLIRVSSWYREGYTHLQMEISLININVSYKRIKSTQFSELLLCLLFLKNNQLKIINMPKRRIWGCSIFYFPSNILQCFCIFCTYNLYPNQYSLCGNLSLSLSKDFNLVFLEISFSRCWHFTFWHPIKRLLNFLNF